MSCRLLVEVHKLDSAHVPDLHLVRRDGGGAVVEEEHMSFLPHCVLWVHPGCDHSPATLCKTFHHGVIHLHENPYYPQYGSGWQKCGKCGSDVCWFVRGSILSNLQELKKF